MTLRHDHNQSYVLENPALVKVILSGVPEVERNLKSPATELITFKRRTGANGYRDKSS